MSESYYYDRDRCPGGACTCDGCWECDGHVIGCTCDIDWEQLYGEER